MHKRSILVAPLVGSMLAAACAEDANPAPMLGVDASGGVVGQMPDAAAATDASVATPAIDAGAQPARDASTGQPQPTPDAAAPTGTVDSALPSEEAGPMLSDATTPTGPADAGKSDAGGTTPVTPSMSAGCSAASVAKPGDTRVMIQADGATREYRLHIPPSYNGMTAMPLVLDFHPLMGDAASQQRSSGYAQLADKEGFVVAYPQGINPAWNVGPCCTKSRDVDDVGFARAVVAKLSSELCLDPKRVYAVGFSNGGGMAHHVACNATDVFAAVAPAAFDLLVENEQPCKPTRPITVHAFRSTNDSVVPYAGGASNPPTALLGYSLNTIHFLGAEATFKRWAMLNQCTDTPADSGGGCKTYKACAAGVEVTLCTSTAGHATGDANKGWAALKRFAMP